jgi:hypothetical protein
MALQKTFSDPTGADATYWIISQLTLDKIASESGRGGITMVGYQDQQTRLNYPREGIVQRRQISVPEADFQAMYDRIVVQGDNPYVVAYEYVQSWQSGTDESGDPIRPFADAEPVFEDPQG